MRTPSPLPSPSETHPDSEPGIPAESVSEPELPLETDNVPTEDEMDVLSMLRDIRGGEGQAASSSAVPNLTQAAPAKKRRLIVVSDAQRGSASRPVTRSMTRAATDLD